MSVGSFTKTYFVCQCDECGKVSEAIEKTPTIYNGAQAARSIGWSFGKDGKVTCLDCRDWDDHYYYRACCRHK